MGHAQLGSVGFRIDPSQVSWTYDVDAAVTQTVGGRVVQVYGVTLGDMIIQGLFGQDRRNRRESWELAEIFHKQIARLVDRQSAIPSVAQLSGESRAPMHPTVRFTYSDDTPERRQANLPIHNWDFNVYIKSLKDANEQSLGILHRTGKYTYSYALRLFIVQDNTGRLAQVAKNAFISRLSNGLGWRRSAYNGQMSEAELREYLSSNSPDGTIHGLVLQQFQTASEGKTPEPVVPRETTGGTPPPSGHPSQRGAS